MGKEIPTVTAVPTKMKVGINYPVPFNNFGYWLGPYPYDLSATEPKWKDTLPKNLALLKDWGVDVVRMFILGNGFNYGRPLITSFTPPSWTNKFYDVMFDPPAPGSSFNPLSPLFKQHFRKLLKTFKEKELRLIPSLVSFEFFWGITEPGTKEGLACGRYAVVRDAAKQKVFFDTMLEGLLTESKEFKNQIFAWEIMNEPIGATERTFTKETTAILEHDELALFLREGLKRIQEAGFESTVGHRYVSDLKKWPKELGTKPQFHFYSHTGLTEAYAEPDPIPKYSETGAFVGEIDVFDRKWSELKGKDGILGNNPLYLRLELLASKGYPLVLVWNDAQKKYESDGKDTLKFSEIAQAGIRKFTKGTPTFPY